MSDNVQGFDSLDAMFAAMAAAEDAANLTLTPGQIRLREDTERTVYWAQALPEADLVVYGFADPVAEVQAEAGFDVAENRERGYLTGYAYSAAVEGEGGDTHVSQVVPIDEATFRLAESLGWPTYSGLRDGEAALLGRRLAEFERVSLGRA